MAFFRRLFRRHKHKNSRADRSREAQLEKAWIGGWSCQQRVPTITELNTAKDSSQLANRNSEFYFDFDLPSRSPVVLDIASPEGRATTVTALQAPASQKQASTSARPPLQAIPGALLSFPRFQEYVCTFLKGEVQIFGDDMCSSSPESKPESKFTEPVTPVEGTAHTGCPELVNAHVSLAPSLVESEVPSLVYSDTSFAPSVHSSSGGTSLSSPILASNHSYFSSSSFSSYLSRRREREHDKAPVPSAAASTRKHGRSKYKTRDETADDYGLQEKLCTTVPKVRHANTYVGSRSMSGPYPCITSRRRSSAASCRKSLPSSVHIEEYYP